MKYMEIYKTKKEPQLDKTEIQEYQKIKEKIIQQEINNEKSIINKDVIHELITKNTTNHKILNKLLHDIQGYGKIDDMINDDDLEEIMIIGSKKPVYVYHREKGMMLTNIKLNNMEIRQIIDKIVNNIQRKINKQSPILDARLDDGSRVNATIPPITADGPTLTIRKFRKNPYTIFDLINKNTLTLNLAAFLWIVIEGLHIRPSNIIIAGGTGCGKTTTLNTISSFIPQHERIITIEDTLELQIPHKHIIRTETKPPNIENKGEITMDLLLKNSLRQRPDRIIIGEVRSNEAITLLTALNTGHSGMGTLHANSTYETITRLTNPPMSVPNIMIKSIDFIIMQKRIYHPKYGIIRRITDVAEVVGMENNKIQLNTIYKYNSVNDSIKYTAINCNALNKIAYLTGLTYKQVHEEIHEREKYLEKYHDKNMNIEKVHEIINNYHQKTL